MHWISESVQAVCDLLREAIETNGASIRLALLLAAMVGLAIAFFVFVGPHWSFELPSVRVPSINAPVSTPGVPTSATGS